MGERCDLSLELVPRGCTLLFDPEEDNASATLKALVDSSAVYSGGIRINDIPQEEYFQSHTIMQTFGYVFDEGIMLSNLSLRENLLLPYKIRFAEYNLQEFDAGLARYLELFRMKVDTSLRPAFVKPAILKLLCLIRSLMLEPEVLLIDNPFYLLNRKEREHLLPILSEIRRHTPMIIASTDPEFQAPFADKILIFNPETNIFCES